MKKLFILTAVGVLFAFIINRRDRQLSADGVERQEKLFTVILMIVLATYGGLRTWYNDTVTYIGIFEQMPSFRELWQSGSATFAGGLGFTYLTALLKDIGFSSQDYIMFYSYITVVPYVWFVRKYSDSFPMAVYLM
ncbi:MAG: EpsG family protein, partial [Oscillospiraceae bacterium]|nr:EpsG family protein [Oscillospiraceae bacterium]